ncbi:hypothetical protein MNBD_CHLOROFLEXI01-4274 [hydrothermal vent metagenome]|uniref:Uncharacterized protein n=1 Tax=hydrothermal vent metagenome TaxID=652676 RepID=A0A3B0VGC5_9ZZZZ
MMQSVLNNAPADDEVVLVNLPQWLEKPPATYAVGVEFVSMLGGYLFAEELIDANVAGKHPVWAVGLPELQSSPAYTFGIHNQHSWPPLTANKVRHIFITQFAPTQPETNYMGRLLPLTAVSQPTPIAQFDPYTLTSAAAAACNGVVTVQTEWLPRSADIPDTTSLFVQVLGADGRLLAQADGPPLGIRPSLLAATPEWLLLDRRTVMVDEETAVPTTLLLGVYDFATGERTLATDGNGQPLPDNAWRVPISACY